MNEITRRSFARGALAASAIIGSPAIVRAAQSPPIRIGFSISQTGGLAGGGKAALVALEMWRQDVNAAGGLLGRQIEFVVYDDKTQTASVPSLYAKLMDIDKVDLLFSPYGSNLSAVVMPMIKQRDRFVLAQFEIGQNDKLKHDKFFEIAPWGPEPGSNWNRGYFDLARRLGYKSIAIVNSDAEAGAVAAAAAARTCGEYGIAVVSAQSYTPNTVQFSEILRNVTAANPDFVFVSSYPVESAALIRGVSEIGVSDSVQMFGGGMIGLQYAQQLETLGSALNGITNYETFVVAPSLTSPALSEFLERYRPLAEKQGIDTLGHFLPPFFYAGGQIVAAAITAVGAVDEAKMATWLHANTIDTIVGPVTFGPDGNWAQSRIVWSQYRNVVDKDLDQFRKPGKQIVVHPAPLATGSLATPYNKARA